MILPEQCLGRTGQETERGRPAYSYENVPAGLGEQGSEALSKGPLLAMRDSDPAPHQLDLQAEGNTQGARSQDLLAQAQPLPPPTGSQTDLHDAVSRSDHAEVNRLIDEGANVNARNERGETPLYLATRAAYAPLVSVLIIAGANVNAPADDGTTPLHVAAEQGNLAIAQILVSEGANPNTKAKNGTTPLHVAAKQGNAKLVENLIDAGANVSLPDASGQSAVNIARRNGHRLLARMMYQSQFSSFEEQRKQIHELRQRAQGWRPQQHGRWADPSRQQEQEGQQRQEQREGDWLIGRWTGVDPVGRGVWVFDAGGTISVDYQATYADGRSIHEQGTGTYSLQPDQTATGYLEWTGGKKPESFRIWLSGRSLTIQHDHGGGTITGLRRQ